MFSDRIHSFLLPEKCLATLIIIVIIIIIDNIILLTRFWNKKKKSNLSKQHRRDHFIKQGISLHVKYIRLSYPFV